MSRSEAGATDATTTIVVHVVRSGGFAGLRREWTAAPEPDEASAWIALIEDCPWDAATGSAPPTGADRFQWAINARCSDAERTARLGDTDVRGPWRALVDAVREFAAPAKR
jgi:hypothetical protein